MAATGFHTADELNDILPGTLPGLLGIVIDVDDIDATLQRIGGMGGSTVVGRTPVAEMGFAAYFTDPEGNVVGLWETARPG